MNSPINLEPVIPMLKAAFTKWPHALATYVCLGGMLWLILQKFF